MSSIETSLQEETQVLATVRKASDLEAHVRVVTVDGVRVVEIRDWIPSLEEYGKGYWVPGDSPTVNKLAQALLLAIAGN